MFLISSDKNFILLLACFNLILYQIANIAKLIVFLTVSPSFPCSNTAESEIFFFFF